MPAPLLLESLRARLTRLSPDAQPALLRRLQALQARLHRGLPTDRGAARLAQDIAAAAGSPDTAPAAPVLHYPPELPITAYLPEIAAALARHQVLVVSGATGSGKSTQIPKLCLELQRHRAAPDPRQGRIGHTQPRRIAARAVAARIAAELGAAGPSLVGHKVRFDDQTPPGARIKVLTDGMLLAEARGDPLLREYATLIVDEAHERTLNIDFLLGHLRRVLRRRPELKLIIASATLEPQRLAAHFGDAPVLEIPGRGHPVEILYRPVTGDLGTAVCAAVTELQALGPGDTLVFLPGEREIRDVAELARARLGQSCAVLPLYARLSRAQQDLALRPGPRPRVILATNVAETSLTVPGVRYVVDSGLARISRVGGPGQVQHLPVEPIAQANATQRAGRCGRTGPGVCVRLYEEDDYARMAPFPEPEIRRASLAGVALQMLDLGLGAPQEFPFLDAPGPRAWRAAYRTLTELGAVDGEQRLTGIGRTLAQLPVDPRLGRMLLAGAQHGVLDEVRIIVAGLTLPDPREFPAGSIEHATQLHRSRAHPGSDFLGILAVYQAFAQMGQELSERRLRAWCAEQFLSYPRLREWRVLVGHLRSFQPPGASKAATENRALAIHRAVLSGLLDRIALRRENPPPPPGARRRRVIAQYQAPHGLVCQVHPGSVLARHPPRYLVTAELVQTSRLYARTVAAVEPAWIEAAAEALLRRDYLEPHFDPRAQEVIARLHASLHGIPIVTGRRVRYGSVAPQAAREIFVREGLVGGLLRTPSPGVERTHARIAAIRVLEAKTRAANLLASEEQLFAAWDARIPPAMASAHTFEHWRVRAERADPGLLDLPDSELLAPDAILPEHPQAYPDHWPIAGGTLPMRYVFDPADAADGITVTVPLALLPELDAASFEWLIPPWREELFTALIRSLPRPLRRQCVPAPDVARACTQRVRLRGTVTEALAEALSHHAAAPIRAGDFDPSVLPEHLRMRFEVRDEHGAVAALGRDLGTLQSQLEMQARAAFRARPTHPIQRTGITRWDFGALPAQVSVDIGHGACATGYPALEDQGESCAIVVLDAAAAQASHSGGINALLRFRLAREHASWLPGVASLGDGAVHYAALGRAAELARELAVVAVDAAFLGGLMPRDADGFDALWEAGITRFQGVCAGLCAAVAETLRLHHGLRRALRSGQSFALMELYQDLEAQLGALVYPGFVTDTGAAQLPHLPRYLRAMELRLARGRVDPGRDRAGRARLSRHELRWRESGAELRALPGGRQYRWLLEELRVSVYAQELGTAQPVSPERLDQHWTRLHA